MIPGNLRKRGAKSSSKTYKLRDKRGLKSPLLL